MSYDLIIKNGMVVFSNHTYKCDLGIKRGKIAAIAAEILNSEGEKVIDAAGKYVLPGMIDTHFHASEPGGERSDWEGFETGSKALAAGGTTTYLDMPLNNLPATVNGATMSLKIEAAKGKNYVDYGFFGGLVPGSGQGLEEQKKLGAKAFKCFMATCGSKKIENDFSNVDDYDLYLGMKELARLDKMLCIHAENAVITDRLAEIFKEMGNVGVKDYLDSRPVFTELEAIQRALFFAKETGCRIHIMHVSCPQGVELIQKAKGEGVKVTLESCPHYFLLNSDDFERIGAKCKCSPPLRSPEEQDELWDDLVNGKIDILSSDHSPCPIEMKNRETIWDVWGGISGCQNSVDIMFEEAVIKRNMDVCKFSNLISKNPARIYGIENKGEIAIGFDADIIVIDPGISYVVREEELYYRNKFTAYEGRKVGCRVTDTIVRGHCVYNYRSGIISEPIGNQIK